MRRHTVSPRAGRAQTRGDSAEPPVEPRLMDGTETARKYISAPFRSKDFIISASPFYLKRLRAAASTIDAAPRIAAATCGSGTCVIPT